MSKHGTMFYVKHRVKDVLEFLNRMVNKDNIFTINHEGKKIKLYLPTKRDLLQQMIIVKRKFYEHEELSKLKKYIKPNSVILDIGSNIGNHAVFFGKILEAKELYCFEPQRKMFDILTKNLKINNLDGVSKCYNIGIGNKELMANIFVADKRNPGGGRVIEEDTGTVNIKPLDNVGISSKIDFIKIDVEGYEKQVLHGAEKILKKDHPILFVETLEYLEDVKDYLKRFGYVLQENLRNYNYLFIYNKQKANRS
ncbi:FkbM family methyltransferase [Candidatus Pacearchaeota archaeon]|nr:FkbM family methyltransferase [Candidatus Pacearchaeota archaeon]